MSDVVTTSKFEWKDLINKEDWWAIWLGFIILILSFISSTTGTFSFKAAKLNTWGVEKAPSIFDSFNGTLPSLLITMIILGALFAIGLKVMGGDVGKFLIGFPVVFILSTLAYLFSANAGIKNYLGYAFWALAIGLLVSNTIKTPEWLKPAVKTEYYIKTGLVVMGSGVLFSNIVKFGIYGLGIAWFVTPIVVIFMWYYGTRVLKMVSKPMIIVIATATSVCGVSAAIAAAAASKAKKEDLTFAIGLTLIFTVIMMIFMPMIIKAIGMNEMIGGAWMGGTIDATGAVVLAGEALGPLAGQVAAMVKMIQNVLIGVIAFAIAVFFATKVDKDVDGPAVGASEIWHRFPKFILGFIAASVIFSFIVEPVLGAAGTKGVTGLAKGFRGWCFCLAFTCIGLESNFKDMAELVQGGKPLMLYIVGQTFNLVLTLLVAWLLLSGIIFPIPNLTM
ncbi:MAG: membrane protein [Peptococcaceae bacterium BICA1-8]|nr:MAG: membrane protein [Peptococcaceae bacterium BICA1-8]